ncbi:MAG: succinate dehydrogenase assembly factor 2 [Gammaproteobacteria bacterium]|nr:succinate dehydrogenase assembly factor 2 [Gammaproteobacteria bacterium]
MSEIDRLRWRCRRGMKELDVVMTRYLEHHYLSADAEEREAFEVVLQIEDPELFPLVMGKTEPDNPKIARVIEKLRSPVV